MDTLEPTAEGSTTFAGELEATEYADGLRDVGITCDDGRGTRGTSR